MSKLKNKNKWIRLSISESYYNDITYKDSNDITYREYKCCSCNKSLDQPCFVDLPYDIQFFITTYMIPNQHLYCTSCMDAISISMRNDIISTIHINSDDPPHSLINKLIKAKIIVNICWIKRSVSFYTNNTYVYYNIDDLIRYINLSKMAYIKYESYDRDPDMIHIKYSKLLPDIEQDDNYYYNSCELDSYADYDSD